MGGYAGKILYINLTAGSWSAIDTEQYARWGGGHGMGSAIFFDLVADKTIDGFHPDNAVTLMSSPLCGSLVPGASGRTEVQGIGVQSYPIGWFTRSNFGGRFSTMLKMAGWDGVAVQGAANSPVWIDIRNEEVTIRDCATLSLWGMDTRQSQEAIWNEVVSGGTYGGWMRPIPSALATTQRPAVVTIGPAGENLSRLACLIHDSGNAAGQGGFGAVWGAKNLKAISVIGTGAIDVADPKALLEARVRLKKEYAYDRDNPIRDDIILRFSTAPAASDRSTGPAAIFEAMFPEEKRPQACAGCHSGCRARYKDGQGNEGSCFSARVYEGAKTVQIRREACERINRYGLNACEILHGLPYLKKLANQGILGPGLEIPTTLDFASYGTAEFFAEFTDAVTFRIGDFGNILSEGFARAAETWGRREMDLESGLLRLPLYGLPEHYDPRAELEWGYGSILGDRDINEHGINSLIMEALLSFMPGMVPPPSAEEAVRIFTDKMAPFDEDADRMEMLDFSTENMYSEHIAKLVAWHRHYSRFWKQSMLFCDWRWPDVINNRRPDKIGATGEFEPLLLQSVTGKEISFADGVEIGRQIWNLDHAIWTLQGRHRDMVRFAPYIYNSPLSDFEGIPFFPLRAPGRDSDGKWDYVSIMGRSMVHDDFEAFKTRYYTFEGWDPETGYPTRSTLETMDMTAVADELERNGKLVL